MAQQALRALDVITGHPARTETRAYPTKATGLLAAAAGFALAWWSLAPAPTVPIEKRATIRVVVNEGDTLWGLAQRHGNPDRYILARVEEIRTANHLSPRASLQPGQSLVIPVD